jgi:hypothetical protein
MRAAVGGRVRVVLDVDGSTAVATVDGAEFEDFGPCVIRVGGVPVQIRAPPT